MGGTRHVKPQFDHGVFRMAVDDKNRMIEIASQDDVTVFTFDIDQEVLDVLLEGEENFIRLEDKSSEDFQTSQSILKELLRLKPDSEDLNNQLRSAFADPDTKGSNPEWDYDDQKESLIVKETHKGRCYLRKTLVLPTAVFHQNTVPMLDETMASEEEEKVTMKVLMILDIMVEASENGSPPRLQKETRKRTSQRKDAWLNREEQKGEPK